MRESGTVPLALQRRPAVLPSPWRGLRRICGCSGCARPAGVAAAARLPLHLSVHTFAHAQAALLRNAQRNPGLPAPVHRMWSLFLTLLRTCFSIGPLVAPCTGHLEICISSRTAAAELPVCASPLLPTWPPPTRVPRAAPLQPERRRRAPGRFHWCPGAPRRLKRSARTRGPQRHGERDCRAARRECERRRLAYGTPRSHRRH